MRRLSLVLLSLFMTAAALAQSEVTVSANAEVSANPDIAKFHLSIIARKPQATDAFKNYLTTYNALQNSLKSVTDLKKITTDNFSVSPYFDYKKPEHLIPDYYQVSASMSLSVPISNLNVVLGKVTAVEGVTMNRIEYETNDRDALELRALEEATKNARAKAEAIARSEGLKDLKVKTMTTSVSRPPVFPMYQVAAEASAVSVNPSSISVSASITVTYTATAP